MNEREKALRAYVQHKDGCPRQRIKSEQAFPHAPCTCGLSTLLAEAEPSASPAEEQGQGRRCQTCNHHRLYHSSVGPCMVLNCQCQEFSNAD